MMRMTINPIVSFIPIVIFMILYLINSKSTTVVLFSFTLICFVWGFNLSCHVFNVYFQDGTPEIVNLPVLSVTAKKGLLKTNIYASISGWMLHRITTSPSLSKVNDLTIPFG